MTETARTYPHGVPCWVDTEQPDLAAAREFYGGLFGWAFTDAVPGEYVVASLDGKDVAALGTGDAATWNTYVAVDDADATAAAVAAAGGHVLAGPADAGPGGRTAMCADPGGVPFRLWQARARLGAQLSNAAGTWNFSHRRPDDPEAREFYATLFGWQYDAVPGIGTAARVPGYGRHLADTVDPGIYERQAAAHTPEGFADVIGAFQSLPEGQSPHWHVIFSVADRDDAVATVERLGGRVDDSRDTMWTREADVTDPQGANFTISQFSPPG